MTRAIAILLAGAAALAAAVAPALAGRGSTQAGDPERGAVVYVSAGCGACHVFAKAGSSGTAGPSLDRWLETHAARARMPVALLALARITWGGRGMPPYAHDLAPEEIENLVAYVVGRPFTAPAETVGPVAPLPAPPPPQTAAAPTVREWIASRRLSGPARHGATVFASVGCLSCHRYLGSGARRLGAPDLSAGGPSRRGAAYLRQLIARPAAKGSVLMPAYGDLPAADLRALAEFLVASRRAASAGA